MKKIQHALVLNLHQPTGNLQYLLDHKEWEAKEILYALDRIPRSLWKHENIARVHLALSGTLLEALASPDFQKRAYGIVDCGSLLWHLQNRKIIDILGGAYYHPVLPLIPGADRQEHINRWQGIGSHLFCGSRFEGFWPPELGFTMELIPLLKKFGYRYVLVDSEHVHPVTPMRWDELRYQPHLARYNGEEIIVIVRDRELSDAQESGMDFAWFMREVEERTARCDFPPLVTTCTDGDNGGWFRNTARQSNFWGAFYCDFMEQAAAGQSSIHPIFIHDYLKRHGTHGEVHVKTGAWNTGWHHGKDFLQWTGSRAQRLALERVASVSRQVHDVRRKSGEANLQNYEVWENLENALWHVLRAETSCNFYWGEAWVDRCHQDLNVAQKCMESI